jgi:hypothetical protein
VHVKGGAPRTRTQVDRDGVKVVRARSVRRGFWLLVLAVLLVGAAGMLALRLALGGAEPEPAAPDVALAAPRATTTAAAPARAPRAHPVRRRAPPPAAAPLEAAPAPSEPELPGFSDEPADGPSGIAVFPPPGTDPVKRGILVPEDFALPEGYVRHYQSTDDGQGLPAILMFHPDYQWLDENGDAIALPEDLVVPPELAPPGLPIVTLELPEGELGGTP